MSKSSCLSTSADSAYTLCAKVLEEMAANKRQGFIAFESQMETKQKKQTNQEYSKWMRQGETKINTRSDERGNIWGIQL